MFSTMMTVASTMMPKSMAPIDSRLADSPLSTSTTTANKQREGNGGRDDQRAAQVAQEQPLDQEHQADAHHHVVQHGAGRHVDQDAAVVDALDAHAGRQQVGAVDAVDLLLHGAQGRQGLRAAPHQHDALDDVVVVVVAGHAQPRLVADRDGRHVGDQHRRAVAHRQHGVADIGHGADLADAADHRRLRAEIDRVGADIDVGAVQRVEHLLQRDAVGQELVEVDGDVEGLALAAPRRDVDHARHRLEPAQQDPVLDGLEVGHAVARRADHAVAEDLADRAGRRDEGLRAVGQRPELRQAVDDELRGFAVADVVGELHLHVAEAGQRDGADRRDEGNSRHLHFDRDGDVALDLLGRLAGILRHDVDQRRHRIGIGLDVEPLVGEQAAGDQRGGENQHENALLECGADDCLHRDLYGPSPKPASPPLQVPYDTNPYRALTAWI